MSRKPSRAKQPCIRNSDETIELHEIKEGPVRCGINVTVLSVNPTFKTKDGDPAATFLFGNGKRKTMTGVAKNQVAIDLQDKLKENERYRIEGEIYANPKSRKFPSKSNSKLDLHLQNVNKIQKLTNNSASTSNGSSNKSQFNSGLGSLIKRLEKGDKVFAEDLKNVIIEDGTVYRYMGCEKCTTSIRVPQKNGKYFCSKCPKRSGEKKRKMYMMIKNIKIRDEFGKECENIVTFDNVATRLLEKKGNDFVFDFEAQKAFDDLIGAKINAELCVKPYKRGEPELMIVLKSITLESKPTLLAQDNNDQNAEMPMQVEEQTTYESQLARSLENMQIRRDEDAYKLNSKPPGLVLLINNNNFPKREKDKIRIGSEADVKSIKTLFRRFGFEIFKDGFTDVKSYELFKIISDFQEELKTRELDSSVVVIMSHGSHFNIQFVDDQFNNLYEDVIYRFSEKKFPEFLGKPKLFIIQACQDFPTKDESQRFFKGPDSFSDILVCFPCLPGYSASRHKKKGSIFIQELCKEVTNSAYKLNFIQILKKVK